MSLITKTKHFFHPIQGEIWCLHRVVVERSLFPSNRELEITPDYLEELILKHKREGYSFVDLEEIVRNSQRKLYGLLSHKYINISFDDGFRDVYDYAYPLFKALQIPFTIFLVGNFPEGTSDLWWIQMEQYYSDDVDGFEASMKRIYQSNRNMRDAMHVLTDSEPDYELCSRLALSWSQLKEMVNSGWCTIGSHSMTHPGLTRLCLDEVRKELLDSRKVIEENLGVKVKHLSYPHSMFNADIQKIVKELGFQSATLGYGGKVRIKDNPYQLNRRYIIQP